MSSEQEGSEQEYLVASKKGFSKKIKLSREQEEREIKNLGELVLTQSGGDIIHVQQEERSKSKSK